MIERYELLNKINLSIEEFNSLRVDWEQLERILAHYQNSMKNLQLIIDSFSSLMLKFENIQFISSRIKDPERLLAKIIRHIKSNKIKSDINENNYNEIIRDIIGIRIVYTFKSDWLRIHNSIIQNFKHKIVCKPIIFYNISNKHEYESLHNLDEFELKTHKFGYRSINYCLYSDLLNVRYRIDLQMMSIFENGWNCVFDRIKNFKGETDPLLTSYIKILKDLSENSDNLASNILFNKEANENAEQVHYEMKHKNESYEVSADLIKQLLADNKIGEAIGKLMNYLKNKSNKNNHYNNLIILSSQFKDIQNQITVSMVDFDTANQCNSKIINSLLQIIDDIFA